MSLIKSIGYISMLLGVLGCGSTASDWIDSARHQQPYKEPSEVELEPYLEQFLDQFLVDCEKYGKGDMCDEGLTRMAGIIFVTPEPGKVVGRCIKYDGGELWEIHVAFFPEASSVYYRTLMYHELGHCLLNKRHEENPKQIMAPKLPHILLKDWENAVKYLFMD